MYKFFRESFTTNLAFLVDTRTSLETDRFFDLCIADILGYKKFLPELEEWFIKRKSKIQNAETYEEKIELLREFIENYKVFFEKPSFILSGSIQTMVENILENNPTS